MPGYLSSEKDVKIYRNNWEEITQTKRVKLYENFSEKPIVLVRLCITKRINGTVIKPEKETAFPRSIMFPKIWFDGLKKNWKNTVYNNLLILTSTAINLDSLEKNSIDIIIKNSQEKINTNEISDKEKYLLSYKIDTLKEINQ